MKTDVLDHGHVHLVTSCADDIDIVNAARVSFNQESQYEFVMDKSELFSLTRLSDKDRGLISYLIREKHGSPFEHGYFKFRIKAPLFVFREWHRHRAGHSYNEWSARYSKLEPQFYVPDVVLTQKGKPGAYTFENIEDEKRIDFRKWLIAQSKEAFRQYEWWMEQGVSKQQARLFLPVNTYSEMIWSCNPRSLLHFVSLRNSDQAQMEIRLYAQAVEDMFSKVMPVTHSAFVNNGRVAP